MHIDRRLAGPHRQPPEPALERFHAARRNMNLAFAHWLDTNPDSADIALEVDGSAAVLHQLAQLAGGGAT